MERGNYHNVDDDWLRISWRGWKLKCCDCGLTHTFDFARERGGELLVKIDVDNRATAAARKWKKK